MEPLKHRTINSSARSLSDLVHAIATGDLDLSPPYQRGDVWTASQRVNLIKSILLGVPIAAVVISNRGDNGWWQGAKPEVDDPYYACIDGKQRLTSVRMFMSDEVVVPAWWFDGRWLDPSYGATHVTYSSLTEAGRRFFRNQAILPVAEAKLRDLVEEAEVYDLINSAGTAHTDGDLVAARQMKDAR